MAEKWRRSPTTYPTRSSCLCLVLLGILLTFISLHFQLFNWAPGLHGQEQVKSVQIQHVANSFDDPTVFEKHLNDMRMQEEVPGLDFNKTWDRIELLTKLRELGKQQGPLLQRKFSTLTNQQYSADASRGQFRLMNWNMLAQGLSQHSGNPVRCPKLKEASYWNFRRLHILEEILQTDPDVIGLQEVDHFVFFHQALKSVGYEGFFYPKQNYPAYHNQFTNGPHGCAMFYKENKFNLVEKDAIILQVPVEYLNLRVSVILTLEPKTSPPSQRSSEFIVATTHLTASGTQDVRQIEGEYLLQYLAKKAGSKPLIVCGDFNAESSSPVYSNFRESKLGLHSAYTLLSDTLNREPPFTTLHFRGDFPRDEDTSRAMDYIWFTTASLTVHSLSIFPTLEEIPKYRQPASCYPSDHFSLAADFILK